MPTLQTKEAHELHRSNEKQIQSINAIVKKRGSVDLENTHWKLYNSVTIPYSRPYSSMDAFKLCFFKIVSLIWGKIKL